MNTSPISDTTIKQCLDFIVQDSTLLADLRSDHAGETGAVWIYKGILSGSGDPEVREFASKHLEAESRHLALMEALLTQSQRSSLLPLWRLAGFLTGYVPSLMGSRAVFLVIEAVETFVEDHYLKQIAYLQNDALRSQSSSQLVTLLKQCLEEEKHHKFDAQARLSYSATSLEVWLQRVIYRGSGLAVSMARHF